MPDFVVPTVFKGEDKLSKVFSKITKGATTFGDKSSKAFNRAARSANRFQTITKSILAAGAVQRGVGLLTQGISGLTREFIDFDQAVIGATARFKDIGPDAVDFEKQLLKIKLAARDAGQTTQFTAAQAGKALDFLARAGFNSTDAIGSLRSMINLSIASGQEFARVADISSDLLGAFGLAAGNSAQKIRNLNRLNDVLAKTTNSANVTLEDMFESMKTIGPISSGILGASLEEVSALTGILGNAGIKGSDAMTALKNAYLRLASPVGAGAKILKELNITLNDGSGGARKMTNLMEELGGKLKGLGQVKQAQILDAIFGKRAIAGGKNIIDNISNIKAFEKSLLNASGTAQKTADRLSKSLGNRLKTLGSAATEFGFKFFDAFAKDGKSGIDSLALAIRNFDTGPLVQATKDVVNIFTNLVGIIRPLLPLIPVLIEGWLAYTVVMKGFLAIGLAVKFIQFIKVLKAVAIAQGVLNAVMMANPFVLIATGVALLITGIVLLVKNWATVKKAALGFFDAVMKRVGPLWKSLKSLFNLFGDVPKEIKLPDQKVNIEKKVSVVTEPKLPTTPKSNVFPIDRGRKGDPKEEKRQTVPPNRAREESRQRVDFNANVRFHNAPENTTIDSNTTGAPPVNIETLGKAS